VVTALVRYSFVASVALTLLPGAFADTTSSSLGLPVLGFGADNISSVSNQFSNLAETHDAEFNATLVLDANTSTGVFGEDIDSAIVRRARLGAGIDITDRIATDITLDFDANADTDQGEDTVNLHELRFKFELGENTDLHFGLLKQAFGMERNSSSKYLRTPERSLATDALTPSRAYGLSLRQQWSSLYLNVGAYTDQEEQQNSSVAGRLVWNPIDEKQSVRHYGIGFHYENREEEEYRIRSDASLHPAENFVRSSRFNATSVATVGLEAAWMEDSVSIQSELFAQRLGLAEGADDPTFTGAYWQLGWVLGDGRRKYSRGRFGAPVVGKSAASTELTIGYGYLKTRFDGDGDVAEDITLGVNRQLNDYFRLSAYVFGIRVDDGGADLESGRGALLRLQAVY